MRRTVCRCAPCPARKDRYCRRTPSGDNSHPLRHDDTPDSIASITRRLAASRSVRCSNTPNGLRRCRWCYRNARRRSGLLMLTRLSVHRNRSARRSEPFGLREQADAAVLSHVRSQFYLLRRRYGSPRLCRELRAAGHVCSEKRVARLMRSSGLRAECVAWCCSTGCSRATPRAARHPSRSAARAGLPPIWSGRMTPCARCRTPCAAGSVRSTSVRYSEPRSLWNMSPSPGCRRRSAAASSGPSRPRDSATRCPPSGT